MTSHNLYLMFAKSRFGHWGWGAVLDIAHKTKHEMWTGVVSGNNSVTTTEVLADIVSVLNLGKDDRLTVVTKHGITTKIRAGWTFMEFAPGYIHYPGIDAEDRFCRAAIALAEWAAE